MKILLFILIFSQIISAQWKRISAESEYLFDVTKIGSFLFAGGENAIYVSDGKDVNKWNVVNSDIKGVQDFVKYEDLILAVANSGIYESNNGGFTWEKRNNGTLSPSCLLPLENIWLAGITSNGVYRSIDYGKNWIYNSNYSYDSLSIVTSLLKVDRKIFAVSGKGLQVSNDNSLSWQKIDTTISSQWHTNNTLQNINDTLYAGGESGLFRSTDHGETWESLGLSRIQNFVFYKDKIFVIANQRIYFSKNKGESWISVFSEGYEEGRQFQPFALEVFQENLYTATGRGLYYMNMSEFDQPKISSNVKNIIELGKIPIASQKDTLIVISNKGYTDLIVDDVSANSPYVEISSKSFTLPSGAGSNKNIFISKGTRSN